MADLKDSRQNTSFGGGNESGQESYGGESQGESYGHDEESGQESFGKDEGQPYGSDPGQESLGDSQSGQAYGNNESQFGSQNRKRGSRELAAWQTLLPRGIVAHSPVGHN
ncbi:hypothetical protein [Glutamicibacter nicotianae]|uniref:hypothetical protein n=1 Tax=Glutamicibacter nicotianae TaxID=37929 RepID=UPI00167F5E52|nr:hypothetical protein [Glutamicibacter nicotianae]